MVYASFTCIDLHSLWLEFWYSNTFPRLINVHIIIYFLFSNSKLVWGFNLILLFSFYIIQFVEIIKFLQWSFSYQHSHPNLYNDQTMVSHSASLQIIYQVYSNAVFCILRHHQSYCMHSHMETSKHMNDALWKQCTLDRFLDVENFYYSNSIITKCMKSLVTNCKSENIISTYFRTGIS